MNSQSVLDKITIPMNDFPKLKDQRSNLIYKNSTSNNFPSLKESQTINQNSSQLNLPSSLSNLKINNPLNFSVNDTSNFFLNN